MPLDRPRITESIEQLIEEHAPLHHGSEVVWALWGAICLGYNLSASVVQTALLAIDPCVALCALHAIANGLVVGPVNLAALEALMHEAELFEDNWLLVYEANVKGWLPNLGGTDFVGANKYFGLMKSAGVSFYDTTATLGVMVKPARTDVYEADDPDMDIELDELLETASG